MMPIPLSAHRSVMAQWDMAMVEFALILPLVWMLTQDSLQQNASMQSGAQAGIHPS